MLITPNGINKRVINFRTNLSQLLQGEPGSVRVLEVDDQLAIEVKRSCWTAGTGNLTAMFGVSFYGRADTSVSKHL